MEVSAAGETLKLSTAAILPEVADTPAVPTDFAVAKPVLRIDMIPGEELAQFTELVRS